MVEKHFNISIAPVRSRGGSPVKYKNATKLNISSVLKSFKRYLIPVTGSVSYATNLRVTVYDEARVVSDGFVSVRVSYVREA
jgi:hypothetical protein